MAEIYSETEGIWLYLDGTNASEVDSEAAQLAYLEKKPNPEEGEIYELIRSDVSITEAWTSGIINCRINNDHRQIRF